MKIKLFLLLFSFSLILFSCGNNQEEIARQKEIQDSLLQVQQDSLLQVFKLELNEIAAVVNEVGARNGIFDLDSSEGMEVNKEDIIQKVQGLDELLSKNQKRLDDISKKMKSNKVKNNDLEKMIQAMQASIAQRETEIKDLMQMLADKDLEIQEIKTKVDSMRKDNLMLTEEMIQMDEEMHKVFFIVGEAKELKEKGVVAKEGGLLGVGGAKKMDVTNLDQGQFTAVDQRELSMIPLYSKKAKLITSHPAGSFEFKTDEQGNISALIIKDKTRFWAAGDYLVVEVAN